MNEIAKSFNDKEVNDLAEYFSKLTFKPAQQWVDTELANRGVVIHKRWCEKCHNDNGAHPVDDSAILAGH